MSESRNLDLPHAPSLQNSSHVLGFLQLFRGYLSNAISTRFPSQNQVIQAINVVIQHLDCTVAACLCVAISFLDSLHN